MLKYKEPADKSSLIDVVNNIAATVTSMQDIYVRWQDGKCIPYYDHKRTHVVSEAINICAECRDAPHCCDRCFDSVLADGIPPYYIVALSSTLSPDAVTENGLSWVDVYRDVSQKTTDYTASQGLVIHARIIGKLPGIEDDMSSNEIASGLVMRSNPKVTVNHRTALSLLDRPGRKFAFRLRKMYVSLYDLKLLCTTNDREIVESDKVTIDQYSFNSVVDTMLSTPCEEMYTRSEQYNAKSALKFWNTHIDSYNYRYKQALRKFWSIDRHQRVAEVDT